MAQKSIYSLSLDIIANSATLSTELEKANSSIKKTGKEAKGLGSVFGSVFKQAGSYIDSVIPGFSTFTSKLGDATIFSNAFSGSLKILKVALASTGIGLIVVALGTLISYFKGTKDGADIFNKALGGIQAVISAIMRRIHLLGEAVSLVLKGKFKEAADKAKEAFSDFGEEVSKNYALGRDLAERENALKKKQIELIRKQADMERDIAEARLIASDKSKSEADRQSAIAKAIKLQKDLGAEKNAIAKEEYEVQSAINALGDNTYADDQKEADLYAKMVGTQKEEADRLREMVAMQNEIALQAKTKAAAEEKALKALQAQNQAIKVQIDPIAKPLDTKSLSTMSFATVVEHPDLDVATQAWVDYKDGVVGIWGMIESQALSTFNKIKDTAVDVGGMLAGTLTDAVIGLTDAFGNLFAGTEKGFKTVVTAALTSIQQIINALLAQAIAGMIAGESKKGIVGLITASIGIAALTAIWKSKVPEFATGTNFAPGGLSLVGERGAELVDLPRGSKVYNNSLTNSMLSRPQQLVARVAGRDLLFVVEEAGRTKSNSF